MSVYRKKNWFWLIAGFGYIQGPVGLSYNKTKGQWTLSKRHFPDASKTVFCDKDYNNNPANSFLAACKVAEVGRKRRKLETVERNCKEKPIEACGVSYYRTKKGTHCFHVSNPLGGGTTVYIGTDENYTARLDEKYEEAVDKRFQFEREHAIKSYWQFS